jgi:hypothetical protein
MHAMLGGGEGENMILKKANFVTKLIISKKSLLPKYVNTYKEILYITAHLFDTICQLHATGRLFSPGNPVSYTNKTDRQDITEILLKVALNTTK